MNIPLWVMLIAFGIVIVSTFLLVSAGGRLQILDHPNERSLHSTPTPRTGGLAIWMGAIVGILFVVLLLGVLPELTWIGGAALLVGAVSFIDDRSHVPVGVRFVAHLIAAVLLLMGGIAVPSIWWPGGEIDLPVGLAWLLSLLFIVWMANLYNFMDGIDGFAGGMAVIGFGTLGLLGFLAGDDYYAALCWVIAAAAAGFLVWNFPPARIFMGDTGSSALGLLAAALSLWADRAGLFPLWLSVLVFSPFVVDATLTLACRTLKGERIWEAHRDHYYQRLVRAGWSHRRTVLWEYGLMLLCSVGALIAFQGPVMVQWFVLVGVMCVCLTAIVAVRRIEQRRAIGPASEASL
jgi:UDP-N-acetylmuramyl pentapeptide phosphotransferase/UDP-N-acetylglucosamine-1-phosphate transferase